MMRAFSVPVSRRYRSRNSDGPLNARLSSIRAFSVPVSRRCRSSNSDGSLNTRLCSIRVGRLSLIICCLFVFFTSPDTQAKNVWDEGDTRTLGYSAAKSDLRYRHFIVVARDYNRLKSLLFKLNVGIHQEFLLINAVGVRLNAEQIEILKASTNVVSMMRDQTIQTSGESS